MDKNEIIKEAQATIKNINEAKETLDSYLSRLEDIVENLEFETLKKEKLMMSDIKNIQEKLKETEFEQREALEDEVDKALELDYEEDSIERLHKESPKEKIKTKSKRKFKKKKSKTKSSKSNAFTVNTLIFFGILFLALSLFLNVKKVNPDFKVLSHYIYSYQDTNMEPEVSFNSLVIIEKLQGEEVSIGNNLSYKLDNENIKIVKVSELVDNRQDTYKTKSISHLFDDEETLLRSEVLGRVKFVAPIIGGVFITLVDNLWLIYLISALFLLIAYLLNNKSNNK